MSENTEPLQEPAAEPAAELAAELAILARALRGHLGRRRRLGTRRTQPAPERAPETPATAPPTAHRRSPPRLVDAPPAQRSQPAPAETRAPRRLAPAMAAAQVKAAEVRARAQACGSLDELRAAVAECTVCSLCHTRTQTVFADGRATTKVMFVGEAPGFNEDRQGVPFVGKAGQLLTDIITKGMELGREQVYIANVLKCRPPDNRDPTPAEKVVCTPWLDRQIELIDPLVIVPLGRHAANHVLGTDRSMGALRGQVHEVRGRKVVPTYHPAYLLRSPGQKKECWKDIQLAMTLLGLGKGS